MTQQTVNGVLRISQKGMGLTKTTYRLTAHFPSEEKFGLVSPMRRPAVSIPSNIAEGKAWQGNREFVQFLSLASGSLAELETQLLLSVDLGYARGLEVIPVETEIAEIQKMIAAIQRKLTIRLEQRQMSSEA